MLQCRRYGIAAFSRKPHFPPLISFSHSESLVRELVNNGSQIRVSVNGGCCAKASLMIRSNVAHSFSVSSYESANFQSHLKSPLYNGAFLLSCVTDLLAKTADQLDW